MAHVPVNQFIKLVEKAYSPAQAIMTRNKNHLFAFRMSIKVEFTHIPPSKDSYERPGELETGISLYVLGVDS